MMKKLSLFLFLVVCFFYSPSLKASSWQEEAISALTYLRANPVAVAQQLGIEEEKLKVLWRDHPEVLKGLPLIQSSPELDELAQQVLTLFERGVLPESALKEVVNLKGLSHSLLGVFCAVLSWENFSSLEDSLNIVLQEAFKKALLREDPSACGFLFPGYQLIGLAGKTSLLTLQGEEYYGNYFCFILAAPPHLEGVVLGRIKAPESFLGSVWLFDLEGEETFYAYSDVFPDGSFLISWQRPGGYLIPIFVGEEIPEFEIDFYSPMPLILFPVTIPEL